MKTFASIARAALILTTTIAVPQLRAVDTTATWLGGTGGWADPLLWDTGIVPHNVTPGDTLSVVLDALPATDSVVSISTADTFTVNNLTISAGDRLDVAGQLTIANTGAGTGSLVVAGDLTLNNGLLFITSGVTFSGGGTLRLSSTDLYSGDEGSLTGDREVSVENRLTNVDVTITGTGLLGADQWEWSVHSMGITNHGTIRAQANEELGWIMGPDTSEFGHGTINDGLIEAVNGGRLRIGGGGDNYDPENLDASQLTLDNTGGTVRASGMGDNPSRVSFEGYNVIQGGDFIAQDGGMLLFMGNTHLHDAAVTASNGGVIYSRDTQLSDDWLHGDFQNVTFNVDGMSKLELRVLDDTSANLMLKDVSFQLEQDSRAFLAEGFFTAAGTLTVSGGTLNIGSWGDPEVMDGMAELRVREQVTLSGGGTLRLNSMDAYYDVSRVTGDWDFFESRLTNMDVTITGTGVLGANNFDYGSLSTVGITNHGTIRAEEYGFLRLVTGADVELGTGVVNDGLIEAINGGRVEIAGTAPEWDVLTFDNTGGIIRARGMGADAFGNVNVPSRVVVVGWGGLNIMRGGEFIAESGGKLFFSDCTMLSDATVTARNGGAIHTYDPMDNGFTFPYCGTFNKVTFNVDGTSKLDLRGQEPMKADQARLPMRVSN